MLRNIARPLAMLALAGAMLAGSLHASAASAAPADKSGGAGLVVSFQPSGVGAQAALPSIRCTITISSPTKVNLGGLGALVEVTGFTSCTAPVSSIRHLTRLYYVVQGLPILADDSPSFGTINATGVAATSCRNGTWSGDAEAFIIAPLGYSPRSGTIRTSALPVGITC